MPGELEVMYMFVRGINFASVSMILQLDFDSCSDNVVFPLIDMIQSCMCFPHASKMTNFTYL
jgi:hypothetical protein